MCTASDLNLAIWTLNNFKKKSAVPIITVRWPPVFLGLSTYHSLVDLGCFLNYSCILLPTHDSPSSPLSFLFQQYSFQWQAYINLGKEVVTGLGHCGVIADLRHLETRARVVLGTCLPSSVSSFFLRASSILFNQFFPPWQLTLSSPPPQDHSTECDLYSLEGAEDSSQVRHLSVNCCLWKQKLLKLWQVQTVQTIQSEALPL